MADFGRTKGTIHTAEAAGTTLASFTAAAAIMPAKTVTANTLEDGSVVKIYMTLNYGSTGTPNYTLIVRVGGTDHISSGAVAAGGAGGVVVLRAEGTVRSTGTAGTILWSLEMHSNVAALNVFVVDTTADTWDTEADQALDVTATSSVSDAANTVTGEQFNVRVEPNP